MNSFNHFVFIALLAFFNLQNGLCVPRLSFDQMPSDHELASHLFYRTAESQQVEDAQKPVVHEPAVQEPVVQKPVVQEQIAQEPVVQPEPEKSVKNKQIQEPIQEPVKPAEPAQEPVKPQEPISQIEHPVKKAPEPVTKTATKTVAIEHSEGERTTGAISSVSESGSDCGTCSACSGCNVKPDYTKAIAIKLKGSKLATKATLIVAAPALINSAKIAALAGLIPIKMAAHGAIVGSLIAKPIIIKSAIFGALATKLSHLLVGKPIKIGASLLAGAEALKAKLRAKKKCALPTCDETNI